MKEEQYYLKIGEMAEMYNITVKTLHLYDKIGLFKPEYIDKFTGYRYYSTSQLGKLNIILSLKGVGFTLKEISSIFQLEFNIGELSRMLQLKRAELQKKVDVLLANIEVLDGMILASEHGDEIQDRLTEKEKAVVMSKIACIENEKFENVLTEIFWL